MKNKSNKNITNISAIRKQYFIKNPEITTEQIQKMLSSTKDYVSSLNLKYDTKIIHSILQSTISLIIANQNIESKD